MTLDNLLTETFFKKTSDKTNIMLDEVKGQNGNLNVETSYLTMKIRTFVIMIISIVCFSVSVTMTVCSIYFNIQIQDLRSELDTSKLRSNQSHIMQKLDSVTIVRNLQLQQLIDEQERVKQELKRYKER